MRNPQSHDITGCGIVTVTTHAVEALPYVISGPSGAAVGVMHPARTHTMDARTTGMKQILSGRKHVEENVKERA